MAQAIELRPGGPEDVDLMLANMRAGFESYVSFAPEGWTVPPVEEDRERMLSLLGDERTWALIASSGDEPVGHVAFTQAREWSPHREGDWRDRPEIPGMAHFWQLFVLEPWWGTGVAATLHAAAIEEIRRRGYERVRLFTPAMHVRARRFYERRGWDAIGDRDGGDIGFEVTEYRLEVGG